ncbi:signal transduction histidine kinase [Crepidotus variabilis]|uniref:Signal transduction histidine kinase n=1 Tax=Crepidotus variabilis TaxID=179855 RepID=A0A9P6ER10_9AGAR|nr:signal transduction histidine kinase [Crepidotus variabilis]
MPILTPPPPLSDRSPLKDVKDDIPAAKRSAPELSTVTEIRAESPKLKDKPAELAKKPSPADEPKTKLPTPEPEREVYKAVEGSEFYKLEECDHLEQVFEETFGQILELDDDPEEREFSKDMVYDYFDQVKVTFKEMDTYFANQDLLQLSSRGHFLKGSSAALGLDRVQRLCEKIQHCGACRDEKLDKDMTQGEAMDVMRKLLRTLKLEYADAEDWLKDFFENHRSL